MSTPTTGLRTPSSTSGSPTATIGKTVQIRAQIAAQEDLYIDGDVEGSVDVREHKVTVGPHGRVKAGIRAREVIILGSVKGNIEASDRIEIRKDAQLVGDIKTARINIEDGAYFKGGIDIARPEAASTK